MSRPVVYRDKSVVRQSLAACWRTVRLRAGIEPRRSVGPISVNTRCPQDGEDGASEGWSYVRTVGLSRVWIAAGLAACLTTTAFAQAPQAPAEAAEQEAKQTPAGKVAAPASQQPPAASRQAAIEQEQAAKVPTLHPYVPIKGEKIFTKLDAIIEGGGLNWHPFFDECVLRRRLHAGRGLQPPRERLQHDRRARQLHVHGLQTRRGRVPRTAHIQPPWQPVATRRLARGHAGRLLRYRDGHIEGRQDQLPVPAAVRVGTSDHFPDADGS